MKSAKKVRLALGLFGCALVIASATLAEPVVGGVPTISVDEVQRGQKGYGLSVFAGTEPERFDVEILGVVHNQRPGLSYILARLSGQDLERSGVIAGMSGSPVYLEDRLAGAVAYSYNFGLDAIAGITPIGAMRELSNLPEVSGGRPASTPASLEIDFQQLLERDFSPDLLSRSLELLQPSNPSGASSTVQWVASGFGATATSLLGGAFGELAPTGSGVSSQSVSGHGVVGGHSDSVTADLVPGSAVAAVMVSGDLNLAAHGTVTDRTGDEILAFGHPVFSQGPARVPLASSEVITIFASALNSFKMSNAGPVIGAFDQDREAGARGWIGERAPTTPLSVRLRGLTHRDYQMEVANLPLTRPILMAISALGAVEVGSYAGGFQGIDLDAEITLRDYEPLRIRQSFDGDQVAVNSVIYLLGFAAFLEFNDLVDVEIERVDVELTQVDRPHSATLIAAYPERTRVEPGDSVAVTLELQPYRGERLRRKVRVEIPEDTPDGRYLVLIGDGSSMDAVRLSLERRQPTTFEQSLELIRSFRSRREQVIYGLKPAPGLSIAGAVLPNLPGSVRSIYAAGSEPSAAPIGYVIASESVESLERPFDGAVRLDFDVRRRAR